MMKVLGFIFLGLILVVGGIVLVKTGCFDKCIDFFRGLGK